MAFASIRLDALLLAALAVAWLPANHYYPWASAWQEGLALLALTLGAACAAAHAQLPRLWAAGLALALASVALQWASGLIFFAGDAWIVAVYLLALALALGMGSTLVGRDGVASRLELVCLAFVLAALVSAGIGFAQWAGVQRLGIFGADLKPGARPFANFGQPNHWCTASLIGLACGWVLFEGRRIGAFTLALLASVLLVAMVASGSRTAWLQLGLGLGLVLFLGGRAKLRLRLLPAGVALVVFALAWIAWPMLSAGAAADTVGARSIAEQARAGVRLPLWQAMLQAIAERPWAGYGWNQMVLAQQAVALDGPPLRIHFEHAHNLLLDLLVWTGVPVGLALIGLACWALFRLLAGTHDARAAGLLLAVGGVLAHSMVEFAIEYAYFLLPMGLMLGAAHQLAKPAMAAVPLPRAAVRAGGVLLLAMLVPTGLDYAQAEQNHRTLRMESARIGTSRIESPPPQLRVLTQLEAFLTFARLEPEAGASAAELDFARRVSERFAYPPSMYRQARWQALNGDAEGAAQTLQRLCAMHPPAHCRGVIAGWNELTSSQPLMRAVTLPPMPR